MEEQTTIRRRQQPFALIFRCRIESDEMLDGKIAVLARLLCLFYQRADQHYICRIANFSKKTAIRANIAHRGEMVIADAFLENPLKRVPGKALKF